MKKILHLKTSSLLLLKSCQNQCLQKFFDNNEMFIYMIVVIFSCGSIIESVVREKVKSVTQR